MSREAPSEMEHDNLSNSSSTARGMDIANGLSLQVDLQLKLAGTSSASKSQAQQPQPQASPSRLKQPSIHQDSTSSHKQPQNHPDSRPDWNNLTVLHRNTLPPRTHFHVYSSEDAARSANLSSSRAQLLSGSWGFDWSPNPFAGPRHFWEADYDHSQWPLIAVPGMWQLQGFGKGPQYTNVVFPFPVDPPNVPIDENECGRYVTKFDVLPGISDGKQFRLRFEGVDAAFTVWLNGREIGYSQGSRNPSEFEVTKFLNLDGEDNTLCVEVYQRCDGSYIEDQDQWWLSGIFRDVWLHSFPETHFEDFKIETILDDDYKNAKLRVKTAVSTKNHHVHLKLLDAHGNVVVQTPECTSAVEDGKQDGVISSQTFHIKQPHKWTAETPYLYTLILELDGLYTSHKVGFRRAELINGVFSVNGNPIKIRGVNRHEHHPESGRTVPYNFMRRDLRTMKLFNINAIRTSHYPNDPRLYDVANEFGFWVIDEADLECHGFAECAGGKPESYTSDNPDWREAYLDRARQLVARDKNHPCVIMWSLGNEAFYGRNHQAMYDLMKEMDSTRLIHYEQDYDAQTADVFSRMYTPVDQMIRFGEEKGWKKPFVMCEFGHAMGNGPGGVKEYMEAFYKYPRLMGGFIWEWANHGLLTKTADGEEYFGYGGDFGDEPNDGNFVMDGLCDSNHNQGPGLNDYSALIQPVQIVARHGLSIEIVNRYDHLTLDHLRVYWSITTDRNQIIGRELVIPKGIQPHTTAMLHLTNGDIPASILTADGAWLELEFSHKDTPIWAYPNRTAARCQIQLGQPKSLTTILADEASIALSKSTPATATPSYPQTSTTSDGQLYLITLSTNKAFGFNLSNGTLSHLSYTTTPSENLLTEPFVLDFYRALTDNDRPIFGQSWLDARLHQTKQHFLSMTTSPVITSQVTGQRECTVTVNTRIAPPVLSWSVHCTTTYVFTATTLHISLHAAPKGPFLPTTFARFGLSFALKSKASNIIEWFGRGPEQSYVDMRAAQMVNTWGWSVDGMAQEFEFPQEGGNRSGVRWVEFREGWGGGEGGRTLRARFGGGGGHGKDVDGGIGFEEERGMGREGGGNGMHVKRNEADGGNFHVSRYTCREIDEAKHPYELVRMREKRERERKKRGGKDGEDGGDSVFCRLDWFHHGLGTGSCGPSTAEEYQLKVDKGTEWNVEVLLD